MNGVKKGFYWLVAATCGLYLFLASLVFIGWVLNNRRISEIQQGRIYSCQTTYEGIREVFKPFFPKHPSQKQKESQDKFNKTIDDRKATCDIQINGGKKP